MPVPMDAKVWGEPESWENRGRSSNRTIMKADGEKYPEHVHAGIIVPDQARGESQPIGVAEQAAQVVAVFVRVLTEQIEDEAKVILSPDDTILLWMVRLAAIICSRYIVGADGRTACVSRRCLVKVFPKQIQEGKNRCDKIESEDRDSVNREVNAVLIRHIDRSESVGLVHAPERRLELVRGHDKKTCGACRSCWTRADL